MGMFPQMLASAEKHLGIKPILHARLVCTPYPVLLFILNLPLKGAVNNSMPRYHTKRPLHA